MQLLDGKKTAEEDIKSEIAVEVKMKDKGESSHLAALM
jgi:hypothetical protein